MSEREELQKQVEDLRFQNQVYQKKLELSKWKQDEVDRGITELNKIIIRQAQEIERLQSLQNLQNRNIKQGKTIDYYEYYVNELSNGICGMNKKFINLFRLREQEKQEYEKEIKELKNEIKEVQVQDRTKFVKMIERSANFMSNYVYPHQQQNE